MKIDIGPNANVGIPGGTVFFFFKSRDGCERGRVVVSYILPLRTVICRGCGRRISTLAATRSIAVANRYVCEFRRLVSRCPPLCALSCCYKSASTPFCSWRITLAAAAILSFYYSVPRRDTR